jgi:hypothetical protein
MVAALQPEYVITLEIFARPTLLKSKEFLGAHDLIKMYDTQDFGSQGLLVFRRKAAAPSP